MDSLELCQLYLMGEATDAQVAELSAWIVQSPKNAEAFALLAAQDAHFSTAVGKVCQPEQAPADFLSQLPQPITEHQATTGQQYRNALAYVLRHTFTPKRLAIAATAAGLLLGMVLTITMLTGNDEPETIARDIEDPTDSFSEPGRVGPADPITPPIVATLTAERDAQWGGAASAEPAPGDTLRAGDRLTLTQGFAEITTNRGAIAILEAPATIEMHDDDNALRLHSGKLVGLCHTESSKGFVVKTDHADITDLGTEFAVDVRPGGLDATVFVGEIALKTPDAPSETITHNQTARVTIEDDQPTLAVEDGVIDRFVRRTPQEPLVTAAYINDDRFTVQVANQSLFEDAKIHTDRNHEINGIDADGLPPELLGADIVLTPANARPKIASGTEGLQIEIETSRPAQVYLLFAKGRDVPAWMGRDYVKTNLQAGIDYAKSDMWPKAALGVGPGQSVNGHQDIWRRKQPVDGRALVGKHMPKYSAYVILAVPIPPSSSPLK